jgi:hypothetical protein
MAMPHMQLSATDLVDDGGTGECADEGGDRVDKVEDTLTVRVDDAGLLEKDREEVRDETVTRELTPARDDGAETESVPVCGRVEDCAEVPPSLVGTREGDVGFDLLDLELDQGRVGVHVPRVELGED